MTPFQRDTQRRRLESRGLHFSLRRPSAGSNTRMRLEQHALLLRDDQHILLQT
jgi:hypothetical protein